MASRTDVATFGTVVVVVVVVVVVAAAAAAAALGVDYNGTPPTTAGRLVKMEQAQSSLGSFPCNLHSTGWVAENSNDMQARMGNQATVLGN